MALLSNATVLLYPMRTSGLYRFIAKKIFSESYHVNRSTVCPAERTLWIPAKKPNAKQLSLRHSILAGLPVRSSFALKTISVMFAETFKLFAVKDAALASVSGTLGKRKSACLVLSLSKTSLRTSGFMSGRSITSFQYKSLIPSGTEFGLGLS